MALPFLLSHVLFFSRPSSSLPQNQHKPHRSPLPFALFPFLLLPPPSRCSFSQTSFASPSPPPPPPLPKFTIIMFAALSAGDGLFAKSNRRAILFCESVDVPYCAPNKGVVVVGADLKLTLADNRSLTRNRRCLCLRSYPLRLRCEQKNSRAPLLTDVAEANRCSRLVAHRVPSA